MTSLLIGLNNLSVDVVDVYLKIFLDRELLRVEHRKRGVNR